MEADDPWNWDLDRVVQELCTSDQRHNSLPAHVLLPDPILFEQALRENNIVGIQMLLRLNDDVILEKLGIKNLGHIFAVQLLVDEWRMQSQGYAKFILRRRPQLLSSLNTPSRFGGEQYQLAHNYLATPESFSASSSLSAIGSGQTHVDGRERRDGEGWTLDESGTKRLKIDAPNRNEQSRKDTNDLTINTPNHATDQECHEEAAEITGAFHSTPAMENSKKRKRLAPTLVTAEIDPSREREIPTQADAVIVNDPQNMVPGRIYVDEIGKKRMVPVSLSSNDFDGAIQFRQQNNLHAGGEEGLQAAKKILSSMTQNPDEAQSLSMGYLGKTNVTVDDVFYGKQPIGAELASVDSMEDFVDSFQTISSGRRLYRHILLKSYLRADRRIIERKGKRFSAIVPYKKRLIPMHQQPSFTLFHATAEGRICARREDLSTWPEVDTDLTSEDLRQQNDDNSRHISINMPDNVLAGGASSYDAWDESMLEKYRYLEGGDEILPVYGDSGSENELDFDTWKEMEDEQGKIKRAQSKSQKAGLTEDEINTAIDEGIAKLVLKWNQEKLPRRQQKAWNMWHKSRKDNNRREQIREAQQHLDRLNNERIAKFRREILTEHWTRARQVHEQTRIMEQSIYDREELAWRIAVLKSKSPPAKPTNERGATASLRKIERIQGTVEEDGESIGSDSDEQSSEDGLDNFIVSDDSENDNAVEHILDMDHPDASSEAETDESQDEEFFNSVTDHNDVEKVKPTTTLTTDFMVDGHDEDEIIANGASSDDRGVSQRPISPTSKKNGACITRESALFLKTSFSKVPYEVIDLISSSESEAVQPPTRTDEQVDLTTPTKPFIQPPNILDNGPRVVLANNSKGKAESDKPDNPHIKSDAIVTLSDSDDALSASGDLPNLDNLEKICKAGRRFWAKQGDNERLLIAIICAIRLDLRNDLLNMFSEFSTKLLWVNMVEVVEAIFGNKTKAKGMDPSTYTTYTGIVRLYNIYVHCDPNKGSHDLKISKATLKKIKKSHKMFDPFCSICLRTLKRLVKQSATAQARSNEVTLGEDAEGIAEVPDIEEEDEEDEDPRSASRRSRRTSVGPEEAEEESSAAEHPRSARKLRKRKVIENVQARSQREQDQIRLAEQEERRKVLHAKLAKAPELAASKRGRIIINDGKRDDDGFVYVNEEIAKRIKAHQIEGVSFMWSQVIDGGQGCLLAHTMGLGKTMQVITLLVAISEATYSPDKSVSSLIPKRLRSSRTLIICPPGLIDNWMDELLIWAPKGALGNLRKIDSAVKPYSRLQVVSDWYDDGGILVMGYEMLRSLILNNATQKRAAALEPEVHEKVKKWLLEGPNIIIADEAHKMKNSTAGITQVASMFKSKTRIALTGSPLANNVEEYHTMIDWVAPGYLGPVVEFRSKYVEPIQHGMYLDSTRSERRKSLKMLGVLNQDLAPKVHRADISVLRNYLMSKTEFVIVVPLTPLQEEAYRIYVRSMLHTDYSTDKDGQILQATLWHWLAILSLLCNHPECFKAKLDDRKTEALQLSVATSGGPSGVDLESLPLHKVGVSETLITKELELFKTVKDIANIQLSNKTRILALILDESKKAKDKVLIFSQSIPTLNYLERYCKQTRRDFARLDGSTVMSKRQGDTKRFNSGAAEVYLISTAAGGLGLNLPGANRVVIFDFKFNPILEEQAIGRVYRIGQQKPVFVYRLVVGGTFEDHLHNSTVFKTQLASKVVDKKNPQAYAKKQAGEFLFEPKVIEQKDLSEFRGKDPLVLDKILDKQVDVIRSILITDIFNQHDEDGLTAEEEKEVNDMFMEQQLKRTNPGAYQSLQAKKWEEKLEMAMNFAEVDAARATQRTTAPDHANLAGGLLYSASQPNAARRSLYNKPSLPPSSSQPAIRHGSAQQSSLAMGDSNNGPISGAGTSVYESHRATNPQLPAGTTVVDQSTKIKDAASLSVPRSSRQAAPVQHGQIPAGSLVIHPPSSSTGASSSLFARLKAASNAVKNKTLITPSSGSSVAPVAGVGTKTYQPPVVDHGLEHVGADAATICPPETPNSITTPFERANRHSTSLGGDPNSIASKTLGEPTSALTKGRRSNSFQQAMKKKRLSTGESGVSKSGSNIIDTAKDIARQRRQKKSTPTRPLDRSPVLLASPPSPSSSIFRRRKRF